MSTAWIPAQAARTSVELLHGLDSLKWRLIESNTPVNEPSTIEGDSSRYRHMIQTVRGEGLAVLLSVRGAADNQADVGVGDFFWPRVLAGRTAYSPYPLDATHTYHYIPDVAAGLATLGCAEIDVYGRPWMLPCAPPGTLRDLVQRLASQLDRPIRVAQVPRWMVKTMAVVMPLMPKLDEMLYQWDEPFVVDDRKFRERFNEMPISVDDAATETIEWATRHYGHAAAPPTRG
jgi:hypothetical protein